MPSYPFSSSHFIRPESTQLSCSLADQGIKIRIRKEIRQRKRAGGANPIGPDDAAEDSSCSLSPTIATNKRSRQVSDSGKGKGKATPRIAKRPKLVEASPLPEQIELHDEPPIPNPTPGTSGDANANAAGANTSTESWTANESASGFSGASAASSWTPLPPPTQDTSSADPEYRAVQHPPPPHPSHNPSQNPSPYQPSSQPRPQPAASSPNWQHHSTQSPHIQHPVQTYVPTPTPPKGYSSAAGPTTSQQHHLVTPPPPPPSAAPITQHTNSGPMPVSSALPRQPGRHGYDVAPSHGTPYGSPLEMHSQPPGHVNPQGPGVTYAPAYGRFYPPHPPSQSPPSKSSRRLAFNVADFYRPSVFVCSSQQRPA
jgi:hypothetical protein